MRLLSILKSKLHHARVTYANKDYVGSVQICSDLMERVGLLDGERVHVWAVDHPARIQTYAFRGPKGVIGINGGAALSFQEGDRVIIAAFAWTDEPVTPQMVLLDADNTVVRDLEPYQVHG